MSRPKAGPAKLQAIGLRAPPDLVRWLKEQADKERRSVSNYAVWALEQFAKQRVDGAAQ